MEEKKGLKRIWMLFLVFAVLFVVNFGIQTDIGQTQMMWLVLSACVLIASIIILINAGFPPRKHIILSLIFGLTMFIAYQGIIFSSVQTFMVTTLTSLAAFTVFMKYPKHKVKVFDLTNKKVAFSNIFIGLIVGTIFGVINLFLASEPLSLDINILVFLTSLSPAIYEEIALRLFIFALCLYLLKGEINSNKENFVCYFMMIVPHTLIHTTQQFVEYGPISGLFSVVLLSLLFGLPFAVLQRKRDLTSAMIAHGVVVIIRFSFLGLPF